MKKQLDKQLISLLELVEQLSTIVSEIKHIQGLLLTKV